MYSSIFNTLMLIGILGSLYSNAQLFHDTLELYLREYYKTDAIKFKQENKEEAKSQKKYLNNKED